jgi:DNA-binding transcriptional LysR family regulator
MREEMDRLEAMSILVASVEAGSFSAAGRKLGVPLPTVSRKVADLEAHLRTRLLVRSTRKLALTDAGAAYLAACKRILEQVSDAEIEASGEYSAPRGELIITAPIVFGRLHVLPVVSAFLSSFPEINVRMMLADRNVNLVDDHIDMAVRIGVLPDSSMIATRVGSVRRVVCGSPSYFASCGIPKTPDDLADLTCVTFSSLSSGSSWTFPSSGRGMVPADPPQCRLNVNTAEAAIDAALAGVGITRVLSYQIARAVRDGKLVVVLRDFEPDPLPVHLVHAGQGLLPLKMRSFLDFAVPRLRQALAADPNEPGPEARDSIQARHVELRGRPAPLDKPGSRASSKKAGD